MAHVRGDKGDGGKGAGQGPPAPAGSSGGREKSAGTRTAGGEGGFAAPGQLSPRLAAVARRVPAGAVAADIGTDHARLPIYLVASGRCPRAIAVEAAPGPYSRARTHLRAARVEHLVDLRLADGLGGIEPGEAGALIIAGLGGTTMVDILNRRPEVAASIPLWIFQPASASHRIRRFCADNGWPIADEDLVEDRGRIYEVITAGPGTGAGTSGGGGSRAGGRDHGRTVLPPAAAPAGAAPQPGAAPADGGAPKSPAPPRPSFPPPAEYEISPILLRKGHPLLKPFLKEKIDHYRSLLAELKQVNSRSAKKMREQVQTHADRLEHMLRAGAGSRFCYDGDDAGDGD